MTVQEMKELIRKTVQEALPEGCTYWSDQYHTQPPLPCTALKLRDADIPLHPVMHVKEGEAYFYYECEKILEINRYTPSVKSGPGELTGLENTAADDLTGLLLYLQSDQGIEYLGAYNICLLQMSPVRDLTAVEGTHSRNRAMQEYTLRYTLEKHGNEVSVYIPSPRGEQEERPLKEPVGYFENVEMEENYE